MLATSKNGTQVIIKVLGHQYRWLAIGYDLEIGHVASCMSITKSLFVMREPICEQIE